MAIQTVTEPSTPKTGDMLHPRLAPFSNSPPISPTSHVMKFKDFLHRILGRMVFRRQVCYVLHSFFWIKYYYIS